MVTSNAALKAHSRCPEKGKVAEKWKADGGPQKREIATSLHDARPPKNLANYWHPGIRT